MTIYLYDKANLLSTPQDASAEKKTEFRMLLYI